MSVDLDDMKKVLSHRNRRTRAKASEKVGRGFEYQQFTNNLPTINLLN